MLRPLLLLALATPSLAQREDDLLVHWRLNEAQLGSGSFQAVYGQPPLVPTAKPKFIGSGESQALVLAPNWGHLESAGRVPSDVLPQRRFSVEGWITVDKPSPWGAALCAIEDNGEEEYGWMLGYKADRFCFALASQAHGRLHYLLAPQKFDTGRWYHLAGVYDGTHQVLYVDGKEVARFSEHAGSVRYERDHLLAAGAYKDRDEQHRMVGGLYELRLWDKALSGPLIERSAKQQRSLMPDPEEGDTISGFTVPPPASVSSLQPAINASIDRGVAWLLKQQHRDGSFATHQAPYRNGGTALALYTLLKQGVPATHPGIQNGLLFLRREPPKKVYSVGCELLMLGALKDHLDEKELKAWATQLVDLIVDWENGGQPGGYGYPGGHVDLSNTQYAALGLWAADTIGIRTPKDLWQRMVLNTCQRYQHAIVEAEWQGEDAGRTGMRKMAGFSYRPGPNTPYTGSMTAAGLCVIGTAWQALGEGLGRKVSRPARESERMALEWLAENWSVDRSPGGGQHLYYLYGVERVGALYDLEFIGKHDWYRDGAEKLIQMQKGEGHWDNEPNTCFALLFLSRATAASATGPGMGASKPKGFEAMGGPVKFRGTGDETVAMWVTGFDQAILDKRQGQAADRAGLRVVRVEYLVDGKVIATVKGDPTRPWDGERYPARHTFKTLGKKAVRCRVHAVPFGDPVENHGTPEVLESSRADVEILLSPETFQRAHLPLEDKGMQLLSLDVSVVSASTEENEQNHSAKAAMDGKQATRWLAKKADAFPYLRIELREPVRANALRLSPATSALTLVDQYESLQQVEVILNGEDTFTLGMPVDGVTWGILTFERTQRVRSLELRLRDRTAVGAKAIGLAEVELLGELPRQRRRGR